MGAFQPQSGTTSQKSETTRFGSASITCSHRGVSGPAPSKEFRRHEYETRSHRHLARFRTGRDRRAVGPDGYFWVPGTWVRPPAVGLLWTPGYWGWRNGIYAWNGGYWGPHVGFYGVVSYGYGYGGVGYEGGLWRGGVFSYNSTVNNFGGVNVTTYSKTVVTNTNVTNVSFNGGTGGTSAQPTPQEQAAASEAHTPATAAQTQHQTAASTNKALLASVNHGTP